MEFKKIALIMVAFLTLFILSSNLISSASISKESYLKCVKECRYNQTKGHNLCISDHKYESKACNLEFKECLEITNDEFKDKIIDAKTFNLNRKNCSAIFLKGIKNADLIRKNCFNEIKETGKECELICKNITKDCKYYYWYDNNNKDCDKKEFCATFMYDGLKVFEKKSDCLYYVNNGTKNCSKAYMPVCGKDGITYSNDCNLQNAKVEKECTGKCPCPSKGYCSNNEDCKENEFCKKSNCDDSKGKCTKIPEICPLTLMYKPVCGCDSNTYASECEMNHFKVSKKNSGACEEQKCDKLRMEITEEIKELQKCNDDIDCVFGNLNTPCTIYMCGASYNKDSDLSKLGNLSSEYIQDCQTYCPMYACQNPVNLISKCKNSKCETTYKVI
ncbi:MAG: Kazal-type serine protease inhibitor domain-containing protein [Candidatus Pacearchaeota archaeon]|jgi:hypothetical protein